MSNDDLIRRGDLLKPDEKSDKVLILGGRTGAGKTLAMAEALMKRKIETVPAVDAVEVVRCKDCKWYKEGELLAPNKFCFRLMHPTDNRHIGYNFSGDDFCSYGERKDND